MWAARVFCRRSYGTSTVAMEPNPYKLAEYLSNKHMIGGKFVTHSGASFEVRSPATGKLIAHAGAGARAEVDAAVGAAQGAFEVCFFRVASSFWVTLTGVRAQAWAALPARQRGALISKCGDALREHADELAKLTALETGKALRTESSVEAGVLADSFTFFGGLGGELKGATIPWSPSTVTYTVHEPLGVCAAIIPWNVPLMLMSLKIAPALVAGNTVVVKSAEEAPLGVLRVAEIMNTILPPGVMNLLSGMGPECGAPLVEHKHVRKVSFTGSVDTGRLIYAAAAKRLIPVTLELGGKSPMLVMDDCDLDKTVAGALAGMRFTRQGQSCTAASRIFVHEAIHDKFVERLVASVNKLVMGDPLDTKTDIGTIISKAQYDRVNYYITEGAKIAGAKAHACSALPTDAQLKNGFFVRPVIFTGLSNDSKLAREEIFGPVTCVIKVKDFEDAIRQANDTEFGLAATIWTRDVSKALQATKRLQAGVVQVNQNVVLNPNFPVGGYKNSGLGREASLEAMIETYTKPKLVSMNLN